MNSTKTAEEVLVSKLESRLGALCEGITAHGPAAERWLLVRLSLDGRSTALSIRLPSGEVSVRFDGARVELARKVLAQVSGALAGYRKHIGTR